MKPEDFDKLKKTDDGLTMVKLMGNPDMEGGMLSLVTVGANSRTFAAIKSAEPAPEPVNGSEVNGGFLKWMWERLTGQTAAEKAADFNALVSVPQLWDAIWAAEDALRQAIREALADEDLTDKVGHISKSLDQFKAFILTTVAQLPVTKSAHRKEIASAMAAVDDVEKAGKVISAANMKKITAAIEAAGSLTTALEALAAAGATSTEKGAPAPAPTTDEDQMRYTPQQLAELAEAAGTQAVKTAKAAGITDQAQLLQLGQQAAMNVYKMGMDVPVGGPSQPALHTSFLAGQLSRQNLQGGAADPLDQFMASLKPVMSSMVAKSNEGLKAEDAIGADDHPLVQMARVVKLLQGAVYGTAEEPGLIEIAFAQDKVLKGLLGTPAPSAKGDDGTPTKEPVKKEPVKKEPGDDDDASSFEGTPFGINAMVRERQG